MWLLEKIGQNSIFHVPSLLKAELPGEWTQKSLNFLGKGVIEVIGIFSDGWYCFEDLTTF